MSTGGSGVLQRLAVLQRKLRHFQREVRVGDAAPSAFAVSRRLSMRSITARIDSLEIIAGAWEDDR